MGEVMIEGAMEVVEGGAAVVTTDVLRVLSIMSTMWLSVELRALEIITGFKLSVLLARLELGGCVPPANLASYLRFQLPLLASLPVVTEPMEMLRR